MLSPWIVVLLLCSWRGASGRHTLTSDVAGIVIRRKPCPGACGTRGNCNYETGRCECPWGWDGEACEVDYLAPCRQTPDDPGSCGNFSPKNCECFRACLKLYCKGVDTQKCRHHWMHYLAGAACWLYGSNETGTAGALARPQNSSLYPEQPEKETIWYDQIPEFFGSDTYTEDMRLKDPRRMYVSSMHRPDIPHMHWNHTAHPLSHCPNQCSNGRGNCFQWQGEQNPRCMCRMGWNGTDCSGVETDWACSFAPTCGGVGKCLSGFCRCPDGRWGWGCHRTTAYRPAPGRPQQLPDLRPPLSRFKIYMYDLPWRVSFPHEAFEWTYERDEIYRADEFFLQYFLTDTVVRTENPYEAHLFYMPALNFYYASNVGDPYPQTEFVINYVRQTWPFFNRSGGADHFVFIPGDRGACSLQRWLMDDVIKVVHFGLQHKDHPWPDLSNKEYGCLQMKRDVVAPPSNDVFVDQARDIYRNLIANNGSDPTRTKLLVFAGGVGDGVIYSGNTRQTVFRLLKNATHTDGVDLIEGRVPDYEQRLRASKFCFAPYGYGYGIRLVQAMHTGCIPLVIQDHVYQPFEDTMPYEEFSVRLPLGDVPRLVEILRSYSDEELARMRMRMAKYYRAFIWYREDDGEAYEWTLAALKQRAYNLAAGHFGSSSTAGGARARS